MGRFEPMIWSVRDGRSRQTERKRRGESKKEGQTDRHSDGGVGTGAKVSWTRVPCGMRSFLRLCFELAASKMSLLAAQLPSLVVPHSFACISCLSCTQGAVPPVRGDLAGGRREGLLHVP